MARNTYNTEILAGIAEIIWEVTAGTAREEVKEGASIRNDLEIDSLAMVELAVRAEERFGVKIPNSALDGFATVGDLVQYVAGYAPLSA